MPSILESLQTVPHSEVLTWLRPHQPQDPPSSLPNLKLSLFIDQPPRLVLISHKPPRPPQEPFTTYQHNAAPIADLTLVVQPEPVRGAHFDRGGRRGKAAQHVHLRQIGLGVFLGGCAALLDRRLGRGSPAGGAGQSSRTGHSPALERSGGCWKEAMRVVLRWPAHRSGRQKADCTACGCHCCGISTALEASCTTDAIGRLVGVKLGTGGLPGSVHGG